MEQKQDKKKRGCCGTLLIVILILVILGGLGSLVDDSESTSEESNSIASTTNDEKKTVKKDLFKDVFTELSSQVGKMSYDECKTYFDSTAFDYTTTEPTEKDIGKISVLDNNGFTLTINFYPDENNTETITLISYSDGDYEGSVQDNFHMSNLEYGIFDASAKEPNQTVTSLEDVQNFILNEVPKRRTEQKDSSTTTTSDNTTSEAEDTDDVANSVDDTQLTETPSPSLEEKNALATAEKYLNYTAFSYTGLIEQLEYEGYTTESATYAADNCKADWNEQAAQKAQQYLNYTSFSKQGLIEQLEYEGFTKEQAEYGVEAVFN